MASSSKSRLLRLLNFIGPILGLLVVVVFFAVLLGIHDVQKRMERDAESTRVEGKSTTPAAGFQATFRSMSLLDEKDFPGLLAFISGRNAKVILAQTVIVAICALGMTMIIVSGGIDLSLGSTVALTSVVGATLIVNTQLAVTVAFVTMMVGGLIGLLNGVAIAGFRMMPFIVTLGMMGVARGLAKWIGKNQTVNYPPEFPLNQIMAQESPEKLLPLPTGVWLAIGLAILMSVIMRRTVFGRYVFAIGSNETAARLSGIRVQMHKTIIYTLAGFFFGLGGLMQMSRLNQGDPSVAIGLELDVIAAVVIGGASLNGGSGSIAGSMIGALIMAVLRNGSSQSEWPNYMQEIIIGLVIILAVGLDQLRQGRAKG